MSHLESNPENPVRHDWSDEQIQAIHDLPLPDLLFQAQLAHRRYHDPQKVQLCTLLSIKTGGCPEDCSYCPQSAYYESDIPAQDLLDTEQVLEAARQVCRSRNRHSGDYSRGLSPDYA